MCASRATHFKCGCKYTFFLRNHQIFSVEIGGGGYFYFIFYHFASPTPPVNTKFCTINAS